MILEFDPPTRPLSINESNRMHWAARRRRLHPWKIVTLDAIRRATRKEIAEVEDRPVTIHVTIPFPRAGRRDPHNYTGTVVKTIVDAIVESGQVVPDDTPEWVEVKEPTILVDSTARVRIVIAPKAQEEEV